MERKIDMKKTEEFYNQEKRQRDFSCSIGFAMTVIGSKWRAVILWHILKETPIRYGQLKTKIPHISHKVLAQELNYLEADNLIRRIQYPTIPPKVEYLPTEKGKSLEHILAELCSWGKMYMNT